MVPKELAVVEQRGKVERVNPPIVTVNGKELEFINQVRLGPFIGVHLIDPKTKVHGFGESKQSSLDKFNFQHGLLIAMGRAEKSIRYKNSKKSINHPYMA